MDKRTFIKNSAVLSGAVLLSNQIQAIELITAEKQSEPFSLPILSISYDALEPHFDKLTMEIHHLKHHQAYINNLNKAVDGTKMEKLTIEEILTNVSKYPVAVRNNGGGHYNHSFFWNLLSDNAGGAPLGKLAAAIARKFTTFDNFKEEFSKAALGRFGSGWAWLVLNETKELQIYSSPNQDNPLMDISEVKGTPFLALDVWEHAYYLKYQNKRADYISAFWKVVNWRVVEKKFELIVK